VAWWLQDHVNEGKRELNFDEFLTYPPRKAHHKLEEVIEMVKEEEMPLGSYTFVHRNARLSAEQRKLLSDWAAGTMQEIASANDISPKEKR
jgi:predicted deacetylase